MSIATLLKLGTTSLTDSFLNASLASYRLPFKSLHLVLYKMPPKLQPVAASGGPGGKQKIQKKKSDVSPVVIVLFINIRYRPPTPFAVQPIGAFYVFLGANILAALFAPVQDCDEVFNYWEPTHYVSHGYGLQTWEYSPEYAIRSWTYIALHALIGSFRRLLPFPSKVRHLPNA